MIPEVLTVVGIKITVFFNTIPYSSTERYPQEPCASTFHFEDKGSRFLLNVDSYLPNCTVSHPRRE
jgi:hypothetical protein